MIHTGDSLTVLRTMPDKIAHCCVTSPPYFGLRDYGMADQLGLEETPEKYIAAMVEVFREVKRVLRDDGTLWLNIGDSYNGYPANVTQGGRLSGRNQSARHVKESGYGLQDKSLKQKDLIGIPWMLAFALRSDGWYLRQDIIWHKPNPMPESVTDRCTKSHEYIFLLSKSAKYYYDYEAIKQPMAEASFSRLNQNVEDQEGSNRVPGKTNGAMKAVGTYVGGKKHKNMVRDDAHSFHRTRNENGQEWQNSDGMANKRSVWTVTTKPFNEFSETYHWHPLGAGAPSDGNLHIMSVNCPNYGGLFDLLAMVLCGEHEGDLLNYILHTCNYLSLEPKPGFVPIENFREMKIGEQSLGYFLRQCFFSATHHNNQIHKTALYLSTNLSYKPYDGREDYIQRILTQHGLFVLNHDMNGSNILSDDFPCDQLLQTLFYIAGKLKLDAVSYGTRYKKVSKKTDHFATFPEDLIVDCIKAGCPEDGLVIDPFLGAGTTALVARKLYRNFIGIELNPKYVAIAEKRLKTELGLFQ